MLVLRSWKKHQSAIIGKTLWARKKRIEKKEAAPETLHNPLSIQSINVACVFDEDFQNFADEVGGGVAETYFIRVLQYVANGRALDGNIPVKREKFGAIVLSRQWHVVSRAAGEKVYDALVSSHLASIYRAIDKTNDPSVTCAPTFPARPGPNLPNPPSGPSNDGGIFETSEEGDDPAQDEPLDAKESSIALIILDRLAAGKGCHSGEQQFGIEMRKAIRASLAAPRDVRDMIRKFSPRDGFRQAVGLSMNVAKVLKA